MDPKQLNGVSLSFIGDAVYSVYIREHLLNKGLNSGKKLQEASKCYVSASGQSKAFDHLFKNGILNAEELEVYKKGRNAVNHIPKNGKLNTYLKASGLEALIGYLYLNDKMRLDEIMQAILKEVSYE